jgi:hypothetical protein
MDPRTADKEGYVYQPCAYGRGYDPSLSMPYSTSDPKEISQGDYTFAKGTRSHLKDHDERAQGKRHIDSHLESGHSLPA